MSTDDRDHISRGEIRKDAVQDALGAGIHAVEEIATIITRAVGDVAKAAGSFGTELFEIRDAARRAGREHERPGAAGAADGDGEPDEGA